MQKKTIKFSEGQIWIIKKSIERMNQNGGNENFSSYVRKKAVMENLYALNKCEIDNLLKGIADHYGYAGRTGDDPHRLLGAYEAIIGILLSEGILNSTWERFKRMYSL